jgi:hypothetical protein
MPPKEGPSSETPRAFAGAHPDTMEHQLKLAEKEKQKNAAKGRPTGDL